LKKMKKLTQIRLLLALVKLLSYRITRLVIISALIICGVLFGNRAHKAYLYNYKGSSVVMLKGFFAGQNSGGTGFQVETRNGNQYTMTNYHVCMLGGKSKTLLASQNNGKSVNLKILYYSKLHDLCLLEPIKELKPLKLANNAITHEEVHIVGHPRLELRSFESGSIVSKKIIRIIIPTLREHACKSGKEILPFMFITPKLKRLLETYKFCGETLVAVHTNAISYGGNSGSPVLDDFGNIVGVLFAGTRGIPTSSLIVPLESVKAFLYNK
jgi:S1-C subfamily serine protease